MAQTESSTLSFRLPDAAAGDRPRYAGMNVERPLLLAAIGRFGSTRGHRRTAAVSEACHLRASDGCIDIREHAELREDHRSRGVTVERLDLAVHETEDVTARRVHPLARWRKNSHRRRQGPLVCTLEGELHNDDVADAEEPVQVAMHVRKRLRIDLDRLAQAGGAVGPAVRDADRHVRKRSVGREALNPTLDVHLFGEFVRFANDLLVVHRKVLSVRLWKLRLRLVEYASALPQVDDGF